MSEYLKASLEGPEFGANAFGFPHSFDAEIEYDPTAKEAPVLAVRIDGTGWDVWDQLSTAQLEYIKERLRAFEQGKVMRAEKEEYDKKYGTKARL